MSNKENESKTTNRILDVFTTKEFVKEISPNFFSNLLNMITVFLSILLLLHILTIDTKWDIRILLVMIIITLFSDKLQIKINKIKYNQILMSNIKYIILLLIYLGTFLYFLISNIDLSQWKDISSVLIVSAIASLMIFLLFYYLLFEVKILKTKTQYDTFYFFTLISLIYFIFFASSIEIATQELRTTLIISLGYIGLKYIITLLSIVLNNNKEVYGTSAELMKSIFKIAIIFVLIVFSMNILEFFNNSSNFSFSNNNSSTFSMFYYSIINITSVGFGDITPISFTAQLISIFASFFGYILLLSVIGKIMSKD